MRRLLLPLSTAYSLVSYIRNKFYDLGVFKSRKARVPTIVLGNLTVGGTGKTPMTIFLAQILSEQFSVGILSRGYKRKEQGCFIVDDKASWERVGDEPKLIYRRTHLPVCVCANRLQGIEFLLKKQPQIELVILDDGFQYRRLEPDLSIVLIDCHRPVYKDKFLPAGNLRDNKYRLKDADIVVFTKCNQLQLQQAQFLIEKHKLKGKAVFFSTYRYSDLQNPFTGEVLRLEQLKDYHVLAFAGIANSFPLKEFLSEKAGSLTFIRYGDHYRYNFKIIRKIFYTFAEIHSTQKVVITTEKDYVKLEQLPLTTEQKAKLFVIPIQIELLYNQQETFKSKIQSYGRELIDKSKKISSLS